MECNDGVFSLVHQPICKSLSKCSDSSLMFTSSKAKNDTQPECASRNKPNDEMVVTSTNETTDPKATVPTGLLLYRLFNQIIIDALLNSNNSTTDICKKNSSNRNRKSKGNCVSLKNSKVDVFTTTQEWVDRHYLIFKSNILSDNDGSGTNSGDIVTEKIVPMECGNGKVRDDEYSLFCDNVGENAVDDLRRSKCNAKVMELAREKRRSMNQSNKTIQCINGDVSFSCSHITASKKNGTSRCSDVNGILGTSIECDEKRVDSVIFNLNGEEQCGKKEGSNSHSLCDFTTRNKSVIVENSFRKSSSCGSDGDEINISVNDPSNEDANLRNNIDSESECLMKPTKKLYSDSSGKSCDSIVNKILCERRKQNRLLKESVELNVKLVNDKSDTVDLISNINNQCSDNDSNEGTISNLYDIGNDLSAATEKSLISSDTLSSDTVLDSCDESYESDDLIKPLQFDYTSFRPIIDEKIINNTFEWFKKRLLETINNEITNSNNIDSSDIVLDNFIGSAVNEMLVNSGLNDAVSDVVITNLELDNSVTSVIKEQFDNEVVNESTISDCSDNINKTVCNKKLKLVVREENVNGEIIMNSGETVDSTVEFLTGVFIDIPGENFNCITNFECIESLEQDEEDSKHSDGLNEHQCVKELGCIANTEYNHKDSSKGFRSILTLSPKIYNEVDHNSCEHISKRIKLEGGGSCETKLENCINDTEIDGCTKWDHSYSLTVNDMRHRESYACSSCNTKRKFLSCTRRKSYRIGFNPSEYYYRSGNNICDSNTSNERFVVRDALDDTPNQSIDNVSLKRKHCEQSSFVLSGNHMKNMYKVNEFNSVRNNGCDGLVDCVSLMTSSGCSINPADFESRKNCVYLNCNTVDNRCNHRVLCNSKGKYDCKSTEEINNNKLRNCSVILNKVNLSDGLKYYACSDCSRFFYDIMLCKEHKKHCQYKEISSCLNQSDKNVL